MNNLLRLFVFFAIVVAIGIAGCAACVVTHGSIGGLEFTLTGKAESVERHDLALAPGGTLRVEVACGAVRVRSSDVEKPSVVATLRARAKDDEAAKELLGRTHLSIADGAQEVRLAGQTDDEDRARPNVYSTPTIDLEIVVPVKVTLEVETGTGSIRADGAGFAGARLVSSYGGVSLSGARGDVEVKSSSGSLSVDDVKGHACRVSSSYGALKVTRVEADEIQAETSSGSVKAEDLKAPSVSLQSGYGAIEVTRIDGALVAKSSSGSVRGRDLAGPTLRLSSEYGAIRVAGARGALTVKSSSGSVEVEGLEGALEASSGYGAVKVAGVFTRLEAHSKSGSVTARAAEGSRMEGGWSLSSDYGRVLAELPRALGFELDAKTGYGTLDIQFPLEVAAGSLEKKDHVRAKVNGGGPKLTLRAQSGGVSVRPLEN